jgi:RNA polymerase sigma-70 factor (ECF subfamily)
MAGNPIICYRRGRGGVFTTDRKKLTRDEVHTPADDAQLMRRIQSGDEAALAELMRRYERCIYHVAYRVAGDAALAEDATVESFYKMWCKARQWRGESSPKAWICRIAIRTTLDLQRSRQRWWKRTRWALSKREHASTSDPKDELIADERQQQVAWELKRAIGELSENDRVLVHLYYFEQWRLAEIASVLDTTRDALKMRLARARKRLRQLLEEAEVDAGT